jgi:hypothetical protein
MDVMRKNHVSFWKCFRRASGELLVSDPRSKFTEYIKNELPVTLPEPSQAFMVSLRIQKYINVR